MKSHVDASPDERDQRLAEIGHHLRNPLTSILAFSEALHDEVFGPASAAQKQALASIRDCARRQTEQIGELMDLWRLESGTGEMNPVPCTVEDLVKAALERLAGAAAARKVQLGAEVHPKELAVRGDARLLEQLVTQLLAVVIYSADVNAVAWLRVNGPVFQAGVGPLAPVPEVSDEALERRLRKLCPVGLALVRVIAALHGGTVSFASELQVTVSLPS